MSAASSGNVGIANAPGARPFTRSERRFPVLPRIISAIRDAWPRKTAAHVAHLTGMEERTVKFWLAGETRMSVDAIGDLLRTEEGYPILQAIMGDCDAGWWRTTQLAHELQRSRRTLKAEEERQARLRAQLSLLDR